MEHQTGVVELGDDETETETDDSAVDVISPPMSREQFAIHKGSEPALCDNASQENSSGVGGEWNRSEFDGLFCAICMEAWTDVGDHQVSCLPCGHIYGFSCIKRWIQQGSKKCPQCNKKCTLKNVRLLYASRICVVEEELQKKVRSLEALRYSLEKKSADHGKEKVQWQKREADLHMKVHQLTERTKYLEGLLEDKQWKPAGPVAGSWGNQRQLVCGHNLDSELSIGGGLSMFILQRELQVDGARYFDVDAPGQILIVARRLPGMGGTHMLTKISLLAPQERENIQLPASTKAVRDLHVSPHSRLALVASLGKKLSVLSTETNNTILSYDVPAPAWSCAWDSDTAHYIYTGLQNGMLLVFDMRQTRGPVETKNGLSCNPIHSVQSLPDSAFHSGVRTILSASSIGLCEWTFGGDEERPFLVPDTENQGVCISLACSTRDDIVASFRPKVEMAGELPVSQPFLTPSSTLRRGVHGVHVLYKRMGGRRYQKLGCINAYVDDVRLPKSVIISRHNHNPLFAFGDEITWELVLQDLTSSAVVQRLKCQKQTIRDVRFRSFGGLGFLGCLSEDTLQLFYSS